MPCVRPPPQTRARLASCEGGVKGALGRILADVAVASSKGTWARMKICAAEDCRWAYYDHSKSRTGRWCAMETCGMGTRPGGTTERNAVAPGREVRPGPRSLIAWVPTRSAHSSRNPSSSASARISSTFGLDWERRRGVYSSGRLRQRRSSVDRSQNPWMGGQHAGEKTGVGGEQSSWALALRFRVLRTLGRLLRRAPRRPGWGAGDLVGTPWRRPTSWLGGFYRGDGDTRVGVRPP